MATAIIPCAPYADFADPPYGYPDAVGTVGDSDAGVCMRVEDDGKYVELTDVVSSVSAVFSDDGVTLPPAAAINSVTICVSLKGTNFDVSSATSPTTNVGLTDASFGTLTTPWSPDPPSGYADNQPAYITYQTVPFTEDPRTSAPWVREDLFGVPSGFGNTQPTFSFVVAISNPIDTFSVDKFWLSIDYSGGSTWYYNPATNHFQYVLGDPGSPWILGSPTLSNLTIQPDSGSTLGGN